MRHLLKLSALQYWNEDATLTNPPLFEPIKQGVGRTAYREATFQILQRGGRKEEFFQEILSHYRAGLKARSFNQFLELEAYFELQIHRLLRNLGCIVEIEPAYSNSTGTVDFRAGSNGQEFYMETTVCGVPSAATSFLNETDVFEKIQCLNYKHFNIYLLSTGACVFQAKVATDFGVKPPLWSITARMTN